MNISGWSESNPVGGANLKTDKTQIVILGGGFAGVEAARYLDRTAAKRTDVEVTLVSRDNFILFTPMLHEVAAGDLKPDLMKIISKIGNLLASATGPFAFWKLTSAKPAADSLPFNVEFPADSLLGITFFVQVDDLLVSIQTSLSSLKLQSLLCARLTAVQIRRSRS